MKRMRGCVALGGAFAMLGCNLGADELARAPSVETARAEAGRAESGRAESGPACATPPPVSAAAEAAVPATEQLARNVDGAPLAVCSLAPKTGFHRDGLCTTGPSDRGKHVVCAEVTAEFLEYTAGRGNDLSTPSLAHAFPGLRPGDRWCLCASRWQEALDAGVAPPVLLEATSDAALRHVSRAELGAHAR